MTDNREFVASFKSRAIKFSVHIIRFCDILPQSNTTLIITRQLIRCATSIGANFVEAQASPSRKDFTNYVSISLKSANETTYWLTVLLEAGIEDPGKVSELLKESHELANILGSIIKKMRGVK